MINKIFEWAWINGLDVKLESRSYALPVMNDDYTFAPRREAPNYTERKQVAVQMPVLTFTRGTKHMQVMAANWAELTELLNHRQRQIFSDLCCEQMDFRVHSPSEPRT